MVENKKETVYLINNEWIENYKNTFDYNILKEANQSSGEKNYLISPYSIKYALSMLREGASGETRKEIEN